MHNDALAFLSCLFERFCTYNVANGSHNGYTECHIPKAITLEVNLLWYCTQATAIYT